MPDQPQGFWSRVWSFIRIGVKKILTFVLRYPAATIITIFLVIIAIVLWRFGKKIQIGGLLAKIWGTDLKNKVKDARITVIPDRKDSDGKLIQPGTSDDRGYTQAPAKADIKEPGVFSNPDTITIDDPYEGEVTIPLPVGVKNTDVKEVIVIAPKVYEIKRNDTGVNTKDVLNILDPK